MLKNVNANLLSRVEFFVRCFNRTTSSCFNNEKVNESSLPYSSLHVNQKFASKMMQIVKPKIKLERFLDNDYLKNLQFSLVQRHLNSQFNLESIREQVNRLIKLTNQLEQQKEVLRKQRQKIKKESTADEQTLNALNENKEKLNVIQDEINSLESELIPILLSMPSLLRKGVTEEHEITQMIKPPPLPSYKLLDCKRLSYFHKIRKDSITGPACEYWLGEGAAMNMAIRRYFKTKIREVLENEQGELHEISGLDFVKSAIVEACNGSYQNDAKRLNNGVKTHVNGQQMHLVGNASLEAICALLSKRSINEMSLPIRFIQDGASYSSELRQMNTIHLLSVTSLQQNRVNAEYDRMVDMLWSSYQPLGLPVMMCKLSARLLQRGEQCAHELLIYFPVQKDWLRVGIVSLYGDDLPSRLGIDSKSMVGVSMTDVSIVCDSILENTQDMHGNYKIPLALKEYM